MHKIIKFALMTVENAYRELLDPLKNIYEAREASNIADWVFEKITGINRLNRISSKMTQLNKPEIDLLQASMHRLLQNEPVQYVLNEAWFYKMKFFVDNNVLIPRPETEELVAWVINDAGKMKADEQNGLNILEVGTGSGCIAIALKKEIPNAKITSLDISEPALKVAQQNALAHDAQIDFIQLDFLIETNWTLLPLTDIIVSNPPYIPAKEKSVMDKNV
ncbi:MAG: HemK/PrmC family methyltransferase, partial [Ginsengibacter sp.]